MNSGQILICDDDRLFHLAVKHALKGRFECRSAYNGDEALAIIRNHPISLLLLDIQMRTPDEGLRYIERFLALDPDLAIVMSSGLTDFNSVREAMRQGAIDYVPKDFEPDDLHLTIDRVLERRSLVRRRDQQNSEATAIQRRHVLIGVSPACEALRRVLEKIRDSRANVVITGETGCGKELLARQLRGSLSDGTLAPFVAVDSATIQSTLAESILFGHERGAFTGADTIRKGVFEEADGGIAYFDEIGNMGMDIQAKLLRVIQEREVRRLGSSKSIRLDFRVVCATNRDLESLIAQRSFKPDLYQRLNVIPIHVPPLRDRVEDVAPLVHHFSETLVGPLGPLRFSEDAVATLERYPWPGNIRELANVVAYLSVMADECEIDDSDLPPRIRDGARARTDATQTSSVSFYEQVASFEHDILRDQYEQSGRNISKMALLLGMDRSHLHSKLKEYGIHAVKRG